MLRLACVACCVSPLHPWTPRHNTCAHPLPVMCVFLLCRGFEHCIANMYLIPLSMCLGSGISVGERRRVTRQRGAGFPKYPPCAHITKLFETACCTNVHCYLAASGSLSMVPPGVPHITTVCMSFRRAAEEPCTQRQEQYRWAALCGL